MPASNHRKCIKTLQRRLSHLEDRIAANESEEPLTYDIAEARALRYAIRMTEMCKSMMDEQSSLYGSD